MGSFICKQKQNTADLLLTPKNKKNIKQTKKGVNNQVNGTKSQQIKVPKLPLNKTNEFNSLDMSTRRKEFQEPEAERGLPLNSKQFEEVYQIPQQKQTIRKSTELSPLVSYIVTKSQNGNKYIALEFRTDQLNDQSNFRQDIQQYVNLIHSNIIQYEEYFIQRDYYFIIMEYFEGISLNSMIERKKNTQQFFSEREISFIAQSLLKACSYMH